MKFRGLIIAVLVLLSLGGLLYWSNHRKPADESSVQSSNPSPSILKLDPGAITELTLTRKGAAPVTVAKANAHAWQIQAPKQLAADQDAVSEVVSTLSSLNADREVEQNASDLKPYGLDKPSLTLDLVFDDHRERKLLLGDDTPAGSDVYAMLAGDPRIFTIASFNKTNIDKGLNDLRDKRMITIEPDKVSRVAVQRPAQSMEFARVKDGWQILKPKPLPANRLAIDEFVRSLAEARMDLAGDTDDRASRQFAQATPLATVTLTGAQGTETLTVRKNKEDYLARSSAVEGTYKVDASLGAAVGKSLDDLLDKKLFDFGFEEPDKVELVAPAKNWFFTRNGNDWWSNGKKMDHAGVESLVGKLRDLTATDFPDRGFSSPYLAATVTSDDGKRTEKVLISKVGNQCLGKRANELPLYQLGSTTQDDLISAAEAIKPEIPAAK